jgi:hypothetical protein
VVERLDEQLAGQLGDLAVVEEPRDAADPAGGSAAPGTARGDGGGVVGVVEGTEG